MTFIELPLFTELITGLLDDTSYAEFQRGLLHQPEKGDVMRRAGGLRKVRLRLPGRGQSGGARVIYLYLERHDTIVLFYVYTKASSESLTN